MGNCGCGCGDYTRVIRGPKGESGESATIRVGRVTTGLVASVVNVGTDHNAVFDFVIPNAGASLRKYRQSSDVVDTTLALHLDVSEDAGANWVTDAMTGTVAVVMGSGLAIDSTETIGNTKRVTLKVDPSTIEGLVLSVDGVLPDERGNVDLDIPVVTDDVDSMEMASDLVATSPYMVHELYKKLHYIHSQSTSSKTWVIDHNLGFYPAVTVVDENNDMVQADVHYDSLNRVTITTDRPYKGSAYLS